MIEASWYAYSMQLCSSEFSIAMKYRIYRNYGINWTFLLALRSMILGLFFGKLSLCNRARLLFL